MKVRKLLAVQWDEGANANLNTQAMFDGMRAALAAGKPIPLNKVGDADALVAAASKVVRGEYLTQNLRTRRWSR